MQVEQTTATPTESQKRTRKCANKMQAAKEAIIADRQAGLHRLTVIANLVERFGLTDASATLYYYKFGGHRVTPMQSTAE